MSAMRSKTECHLGWAASSWISNPKVINFLEVGLVTMRIFLIEDNPVDALWLKRELGALPDEFTVSEVQSLAEAKETLSTERYDVILLDLGLPDSNGLETFLEIQPVASDIPVVLLTGMDDRQLAIDAVAKGAQDYLVKGSADSHAVVRSLNYGIERHRILTEHKEAVEKERKPLAP